MSETLANPQIDIPRAPHSFDSDGSVFIHGVRNGDQSIVVVSDREAILKIDEAAGELEKILKSEKHKASLFASSRW